MKQDHHFILASFLSYSENSGKTRPINNGHFVIATIVSALCLFSSMANAQCMTQAMQLAVSENYSAVTTLPNQFINSSYIVSGIIADSTGESLVGATIELLPRGEVIVGAIANEEGKFSLEVPASYTKDSILISVRYVGFFPQQIGLSLRQNNDHVKVCLLRDPRIIGCPLIVPSEQSKVNLKTDYDLIQKPEPIKIPGNKS